jgi:hypothetical protein
MTWFKGMHGCVIIFLKVISKPLFTQSKPNTKLAC